MAQHSRLGREANLPPTTTHKKSLLHIYRERERETLFLLCMPATLVSVAANQLVHVIIDFVNWHMFLSHRNRFP